MKRLKIRKIKITYNTGVIKEYETFRDEYIESFANTIKGEECFHIIIHCNTDENEIQNEWHHTFKMNDIKSIIQEWR